MGLGECECYTVHGAELAQHGLVLLPPLVVDALPFLAGELVDIGGNAVVFSGAHEVFSKVAARNVPVRTQLMEMVEIAGHGLIRIGLDGVVGVAQLVGPFVVGVRKDEWSGFTRDRAASTSTRAGN